MNWLEDLKAWRTIYSEPNRPAKNWLRTKNVLRGENMQYLNNRRKVTKEKRETFS
jgi:hypothetical protein